MLDRCEESVRSGGVVVLESPNLSLVDCGEVELVRVGKAPRLEFTEWRYGRRLPLSESSSRATGFLRSLLEGLPPPPVDGYQPYRMSLSQREDRWLASPFQSSAVALTTLFTQFPFAPGCPSCARPMPLNPWDFQRVRLVVSGDTARLLVPCALCGDEVLLEVREGRPALRLGMSLVDSIPSIRGSADSAAREIDGAEARGGYLHTLARERATLGELGTLERVALAIVLDEAAETEALEDEWRKAEEISAIMDGELTEIPGFHEFRRRVLEEDG
ncbi:MAG: hypothetical protein KAJ42_06890 [Gemmatimonadetes bacterium]|nr:hypothetical protein [Gemmatimonadota bacterium]